jgi:hypothetical protein
MELLQYLEQFYPTRDQLSEEGQFSAGVRNKAAFVNFCKIVFPAGRTFSSSRQVAQVVKLLQAPKRKLKPDAADKKQYDTSETPTKSQVPLFFSTIATYKRKRLHLPHFNV